MALTLPAGLQPELSHRGLRAALSGERLWGTRSQVGQALGSGRDAVLTRPGDPPCQGQRSVGAVSTSPTRRASSGDQGQECGI